MIVVGHLHMWKLLVEVILPLGASAASKHKPACFPYPLFLSCVYWWVYWLVGVLDPGRWGDTEASATRTACGLWTVHAFIVILVNCMIQSNSR